MREGNRAQLSRRLDEAVATAAEKLARGAKLLVTPDKLDATVNQLLAMPR